jgi:hypothetical protein
MAELIEYWYVPMVNFRWASVPKPEGGIRIKMISIAFDVVFSSIMHFQPSGSGWSSRGSR